MVYYDTVVVQVDLKDKWRNMMKPKVTIKKKPYEGIGERRPTIRWTTKELEALLAGVDKCAQHTFYPACDVSTAFMQVNYKVVGVRVLHTWKSTVWGLAHVMRKFYCGEELRSGCWFSKTL